MERKHILILAVPHVAPVAHEMLYKTDFGSICNRKSAWLLVIVISLSRAWASLCVRAITVIPRKAVSEFLGKWCYIWLPKELVSRLLFAKKCGRLNSKNSKYVCALINRSEYQNLTILYIVERKTWNWLYKVKSKVLWFQPLWTPLTKADHCGLKDQQLELWSAHVSRLCSAGCSTGCWWEVSAGLIDPEYLHCLSWESWLWVHICNPSLLGGWERRNTSSNSVWATKWDPVGSVPSTAKEKQKEF